MYIVGAAHPNKQKAQSILERHILAGDRLCTSAEVFQEILHRYVAIRRRDAIAPAFEVLQASSDVIFPVEFDDVEGARALLMSHPDLSSRDALHATTMRRNGIGQIMSFDAGFDGIEGIRRVVA